jgi:hypothetical protein
MDEAAQNDLVGENEGFEIMPITVATIYVNPSGLPGRLGIASILVAAVGLLAGCGFRDGPEKRVRGYPLDLGARSEPGMVCGLLDRSQVAALTGVPSEVQHEDSSFRVYPTSGWEFRPLDCIVRDESYPQRELLGIVVTQDMREEEVLLRRQSIDPKVGALRVPRIWGDGGAAPRAGGYVIRRCPNGGKYFVHTSTLDKFGTAQQWLDIMGSVIKRADAAGACVPRPLIGGPSSSKSSTR